MEGGEEEKPRWRTKLTIKIGGKVLARTRSCSLSPSLNGDQATKVYLILMYTYASRA